MESNWLLLSYHLSSPDLTHYSLWYPSSQSKTRFDVRFMSGPSLYVRGFFFCFFKIVAAFPGFSTIGFLGVRVNWGHCAEEGDKF